MAVTRIRENQQNISRGALDPVKTVSTANVDVGTGGLIAVNGYTVQDGDRVLLVGQTTTTQDGIYLARSSAWERAEDAEAGDDIGSALIVIEEGSNAGELWQIGNNRGSGVVGTDDLTAAEHTVGGGSNTRVFGETPTVTDGSATVTLANTPIAATVRVYLNGLRQNEGGSNDYTVSGAVITFNFTLKNNPAQGREDVVVVDYEY
jgi:hypothetical protein